MFQKISLSLFFVFSLSFSQAQMSKNENKAAIKEVLLEAYANAMHNRGDLYTMQLGFSTDFVSYGLTAKNEVIQETFEDWLNWAISKKESGGYPSAPNQQVTLDFQSIDIVEEMAMVKLSFKVGGKTQRIDFMGLYHFQEGWKIVSRAYQMIPTKS